jgi:hypothetical protein
MSPPIRLLYPQASGSETITSQDFERCSQAGMKFRVTAIRRRPA